MMKPTPILEGLPAVRGTLVADAPLDKLTWFRTGGRAQVLYTPADVDDLAAFLAARPCDVPLTVIGLGSNLLVRDGGVPGVVIHLGKPFAGIALHEDRILAGAAALDRAVAAYAQSIGMAGLEFLVGIPGTIGGALRMNAGCYGGDMQGITQEARALDTAGNMRFLNVGDLGFTYRHAAVPEDWIFLDALLEGPADSSAAIAARMADIRRQREISQPLGTRTGGSTFANPPGLKAWELIDRAGCRGLSRGAARVSDKHCNFLINEGTAGGDDLEALGEEVRRRVLEHCGVALVWEIRRIGFPRAQGPTADGGTSSW
jgi:UDP-N-acetylmuramate dehydrogenase